MNIIYNFESKMKEKTCVALGNFDGVHLGHRRIFETAKKYGEDNKLISCIYTFSSHPSELLGNNKKILTDLNEKSKIFDSLGIEILYLDEFSEVRTMSPKDFCKTVLKDKLNAKYVFCGNNYTFGYLGKGNVNILKKELDELNIELIVVPYVFTNNNTIISSTYIRNLITDGNVKEASDLMMHYYKINGTIVHGKHLGRTLGFPTLNISIPPNKVIPKFGVYVTLCELDGELYQGITNVGIRPTTDTGTVNESTVNCETYLFNYNGDAYGKVLSVYFCNKIRDEICFGSINELKQAIDRDVFSAKKYFDETKICNKYFISENI